MKNIIEFLDLVRSNPEAVAQMSEEEFEGLKSELMQAEEELNNLEEVRASLPAVQEFIGQISKFEENPKGFLQDNFGLGMDKIYPDEQSELMKSRDDIKKVKYGGFKNRLNELSKNDDALSVAMEGGFLPDDELSAIYDNANGDDEEAEAQILNIIKSLSSYADGYGNKKSKKEAPIVIEKTKSKINSVDDIDEWRKKMKNGF